MSEPKGIYKTQLPGVAIYASNKRGNTIEIDLQTYDQLKAMIDQIKADLEEAQAIIESKQLNIDGLESEVNLLRVLLDERNFTLDREARALIERQAKAIAARDALFMRYYEASIDWMAYIAEMQALMSSTSVTGGDER